MGQGHRHQTQQFRVLSAPFHPPAGPSLPASGLPQASGSQSHKGKDCGHLRGAQWPRGWGNRGLPELPGGCQAMAPTCTLSHIPPTLPPAQSRRKNSAALIPPPPASSSKGSRLRKPIYYLHQVPSTQAFKITGWQSDPNWPEAAGAAEQAGGS